MKSFSKTRCAILSIYSFPLGLAPTNRILAYAKGMVENGASVDVFIPFPTERPTTASIYGNSGIYQGVSYYYTSGRFTSKYKLFRAVSILSRYRKVKGYITSYRKIYQASKQNKYSCIIISTDQILALLVYSILAKKIKSHSIFIFDEFPIPIRHKLKDRITKWKEYLYKKVLKNINAYISISEELKRYYNNFYSNKTYVLPVIVDVSRFNSEEKQITELASVKNLCYMGNMELSKDDVDNIIRAFALISDKYTSIKLYLYGPPKSNTKNYLNNLISSLNLQNRAFLMGRANSDKVPQILTHAHILVSSQPNTIRASGGFPTKLGEYLASGVPALLTDVGENAKYVKDDVHIFFSKPGDHKAYAEKLTYIIENYEHALKVAANGKQYLLSNYSHIKKGRELLEFISNI